MIKIEETDEGFRWRVEEPGHSVEGFRYDRWEAIEEAQKWSDYLIVRRMEKAL